MLPPYVQDVTQWVNYYRKHAGNKLNASAPNQESALNNVKNSSGLAQTGSMSVLKVEPRGPAPPVPSTGPSAALKTTTASEASLQQAIYDAKRAQIQQSKAAAEAGGSRLMKKQTKTPKAVSKGKSSKSQKGTGPKVTVKRTSKKKKDLFGSPADIFKFKTKKTR